MFSVCFVVLLLLPSVLGVLYPMHREQVTLARIKPSRHIAHPRSR